MNMKTNTKEQIFNAYTEMKKKLEEAESTKSNPVQVMQEKVKAETVQKVDKLVTTGTIEQQIKTLQDTFTSVTGSLSKEVASKFEEYNSVKDAIQIQQEKLKELFDIEREALTLVALVNSKREIQQAYETQYVERKTQAEQDLATIVEQTKVARENLAKELSEKKAQIEKDRKREQEEYAYEFNRKKQKAQDELDDLLASRKREFNEIVEKQNKILGNKENELDERESDLETREQTLEGLEDEIELLKQKEVIVRKEVEEEITKRLNANFDKERVFAKREVENQKLLLQKEIDMLQQQLANATAHSLELTKKLDSAYVEIKDMATRSIESAGDKKVVESLQRVISESNKKEIK